MEPTLLQNDFFAFFQPAQEFSFGAVRDSDVDRHFAFTFLAFGIRHLDRRFLILVVENRALRDLKDRFVFFQNDLCVGRHIGFQFATRIVDRRRALRKS